MKLKQKISTYIHKFKLMSRADLKSDLSNFDELNDLIMSNNSKEPATFAFIPVDVEMSVITSTFFSCNNIETGCDFWNHKYMIVMTRFVINDTDLLICLDLRCSIMLIDDLFIKKYTLKTEIWVMTMLISVDKIIRNKHMTDKYIVLTWYFLSQKADETWALFKIKREVHIMTGLHTNMLVEMNVMSPKHIDLITLKKHVIIESTDTLILIDYKLSSSLIRWVVQALESTMIALHFKVIIPVQHLHDLSPHNYVFSSDDTFLLLYVHLINEWFNLIVDWNNTDEAVMIEQRHCLEMLMNIKYDNCYHV